MVGIDPGNNAGFHDLRLHGVRFTGTHVCKYLTGRGPVRQRAGFRPGADIRRLVAGDGIARNRAGVAAGDGIALFRPVAEQPVLTDRIERSLEARAHDRIAGVERTEDAVVAIVVDHALGTARRQAAAARPLREATETQTLGGCDLLADARGQAAGFRPISIVDPASGA